jgi:hypothetical protein
MKPRNLILSPAVMSMLAFGGCSPGNAPLDEGERQSIGSTAQTMTMLPDIEVSACQPLQYPPPPCNNAVCVGDSWEFEPIIGGASCALPSGESGRCGYGPEAGSCYTTVSGALVARYYVLGVDYAPPGSASTVRYSIGSSWGTTTTNTDTWKNIFNVTASNGSGFLGFGAGGIEVSASRTDEGISTESWDVKGTIKSDFSIAGGGDLIDHSLDRIYLWLSPQINVTTYGSTVEWSLTTEPGQMGDLVYVTPTWLLNDTLPQNVRDALASAGISSVDYAQILSVDPYASATPTLDTDRFAYQTTLPYEPVTVEGGTPTTSGFTITKDTTHVTSKERKVGYDVGVTLRGSFSFFDIMQVKLKVSDTISWSSSKKTATTDGTSLAAQATIRQPPFGYTGPVFLDVYLDTVFNSFLFILRPPGPPPCVDEPPATTCAGKQCGTAVNNCGLTVVCPNTCVAPTICGGVGAGPNDCGCNPQSLTTTCLGKQCGPATNNCGQAVTCPDTCVWPQTCGGGGAGPNACGCFSNGDPCGIQCDGTATDNCGNVWSCYSSCGLDGQCPGSGGTCNATSHYCDCREGDPF